MKDFRIILLLLALPLAVCASPQAPLRWNTDGTVQAQSETVKTGLQNAYTAIETALGIYVAGFKIDDKGANHPVVVFLSQDLKTKRSWPMPGSVTQFFLFKNALHVLTIDGQALQTDGLNWSGVGLAFKRDSFVVWSDDDLVACNPAPLLMNDKTKGGCYSLFKGWQFDANWREVKPQICNGNLMVLEARAGVWWLRQLDVTSGAVLVSRKISDLVSDLCLIKM